MFLVMLNGAATGAAETEAEALTIANRIDGAGVEARPEGIDYQEAAAIMARQCERLGISVKWRFIPWSDSRSADEKDERGNPRYSLNWKADVAGLGLAGVDYMQGAGHCPADKLQYPGNNAHLKRRAIAHECQQGRRAVLDSFGEVKGYAGKPIDPPSVAELVSSLAMDSDTGHVAAVLAAAKKTEG